MIYKLIVINSCIDCPHFVDWCDDTLPTCSILKIELSLSKRSEDILLAIPEDCPLEDCPVEEYSLEEYLGERCSKD
jgi:hypothetical protein